MNTINKRHSFNALLIACALLQACITFAYAVTRLYTFKTSLTDLGTFDQILWNLAQHGTALNTTTEPYLPKNWFGFHFSPVLLLLVPFYVFWPHPEWLQLAQSLALAFSGVFVFHMLEAAGAARKEAWAGAALYWLNPFVLSAAVWDFHEIAFATLFVSIALWALAARRFMPMCLALILLLLTKEEYGLSVAGFGFLWGYLYKDWRRGGAVLLLGLMAQVVILKVIMPALYGVADHPMFQSSGSYLSRYGWMGEPWPEKLRTLWSLLVELSDNNIPGVLYLFMLLLGGLMLPLFSPLILAAGAGDLVANLLSSNPMMRHVSAYHSAPIIPVVLFAAWRGYRFLIRLPWMRQDLLRFALMLMAAFIPIFDFSSNPLRLWELDMPVLSVDRGAVRAVKDRLPPGPIAVQCNIGAYFSERDALYPFPHKIELVNSVVLQLSHPYFDPLQNRFNNPFCELPGRFIPHVRAFLKEPGWHIAYWQSPWLVMQRGAPAQDEIGKRQEIDRQIGIMAGSVNFAIPAGY